MRATNGFSMGLTCFQGFTYGSGLPFTITAEEADGKWLITLLPSLTKELAINKFEVYTNPHPTILVNYCIQLSPNISTLIRRTDKLTQRTSGPLSMPSGRGPLHDLFFLAHPLQDLGKLDVPLGVEVQKVRV